MRASLPIWTCVLLTGCGLLVGGGDTIVPEEGYDWPDNVRDYWPTRAWRSAPMTSHGVDPLRMKKAAAFARNDPKSRGLLVVRHGKIVFEEYFADGARDRSSEVWSVTKSVTSAVVGIAVARGQIPDVHQRMADLCPQYPEFGDIRLIHALTHTTGLRFTEEGMSWIRWVMSKDWVAEALRRGQDRPAGEHFRYGSQNSHFLSTLVFLRTGKTPGELAERHLFGPLGIRYERLREVRTYTSWDGYKIPLPRSWRQDPRGIEIGGFGLSLTARDMAKIGFLYLNRGAWDGAQILPEHWVVDSTRDHVRGIGRYSYGYQWWITLVAGHPGFLASGLGGQIVGVVPSLDLVVVIQYDPIHPQNHTDEVHDDMKLFRLVVESVAAPD
ncbi:MAG: serine hydrolase domain-containing protein [Planctomycetota bacterium]|jgi:CubicO group peptidase (beta-lactamase class C family)